jgi:hypothetical protein
MCDRAFADPEAAIALSQTAHKSPKKKKPGFSKKNPVSCLLCLGNFFVSDRPNLRIKSRMRSVCTYPQCGVL